MCADTAAACAWTAAWLRDRWGLAATTTLRLTSPQAAMVSIIAALIACIVALSRVLITPWHWNAWRVVMRRPRTAYVVATASSLSHCAGVTTPPGVQLGRASCRERVCPYV